MSASSRTPPRATRTYSRPSDRAIDFAIDVLPTPGGPEKSRIGPLAIARAFASFLSVTARCSPVTFSTGVASRALRLERGDRHLARGLDLVRHLLRAQLAHGQELEHAVLHVGQAVVVLVEHLSARASRSRLSSLRVFHGSSAIHSR